jgi:hypothetical protein
MASMVVFSAFLALLFGGMMLALVMGYLSTEQRRAEGERQASMAVQTAVPVPRFFAELGEEWQEPARDGPEDEFVDQIEGYLREEQALVARFVKDPSIDNLYRQVPASPLIQ